MYTTELPEHPLTTTLVKIRYNCCGKDHTLKWKDADKNFKKNNGKHICRACWLKSDNPAKKEASKDRAKKTNLERYGTTCTMNTPELIAKRSKKFKNEEFLEQWNEKRRQTCLEKYGVEHHNQAEEVKEKQRQTLLNNYGVDSPMKSKIIWEKAHQTVLERYGVDNVSQSPEIREKMYKTTEERYGVKHYNELPEMREYMREHCREWLAESWASGGPNKGVPRPEEWSQKQRDTVIKLIIEGKWLGGYGKGRVQGWVNHPNELCRKKNPYFRSYLELFTHIRLNEHGDVEWYENEPFGIDYQLPDGSTHRYVVDFMIKFKNDSRIHLIETKPKFKKIDEKVLAKENAANILAEIEGFVYSYWDEDDVALFRLDKEEVFSRPYVKLRRKDEPATV